MHNTVLHTLEYINLSTSAFFSYFSHLPDVASSSLQIVQVAFSSELKEVLDEKLQTQWNEVDNALCDTKFKQLQFFQVDDYQVEMAESQAQASLKKLLPKCYKKKILWCDCRGKSE